MNARSCLMISVISSALTPVAVIAFRHSVWAKKYCLIWRPRLSVCLWWTKLFVIFLWNSLKEFFTRNWQAFVSFVKSVQWHPLHKDISEFAPILSIYSGPSKVNHNRFQEAVQLSLCSTFELNFPVRNNVNWINRFKISKISSL